MFFDQPAIAKDRRDRAHGHRETAGAGGLLAESVMLKRNTFVANAAFIAANPQGGNDIVGVLQGCDRVGGGTKLNIRANGIKYIAGNFAKYRQIISRVIEKNDFC